MSGIDRSGRALAAGVLVIGFWLALLVMSAEKGFAHHSFVRKYDANRVVTLRGVVTSVLWQNPHIFVQIDVKGVNWTVELEGIPKVQGKGLSREMVSEGTAVEITGWPDRSGSAELGLKTIKVKGRTISIRTTAR